MSTLKLPPQLLSWSDTEHGWVSVADAKRMHLIRASCAIGRAKHKLSTFEWNALALYIKKQVLEDQQIEHP